MVHDRAEVFDIKTEMLFRYLQVVASPPEHLQLTLRPVTTRIASSCCNEMCHGATPTVAPRSMFCFFSTKAPEPHDQVSDT